MRNFNVTVFILVLATCVAQCLAAGGVKGAFESQRAASAVKGPRQLSTKGGLQALPAPLLVPQAPIAPPAAPIAVKGAGQAAPIFTAVRVQQPQPQPLQPVQALQPVFAPRPVPLPVQQIVFAPQPQPQPQPQVQIVQQQQQQEQEPEPSEVDPNAAAQDSQPAAIAPAAAVVAAPEEEANPKPEPYAFRYGFESGDAATAGSSLREEQQDAAGTVTGFYTLKGEDGRDRRVNYIADANGFRATISTNEMGTAPKDPADVQYQAQAPTEGQVRAADAALAASKQREAIVQAPLTASSNAAPALALAPSAPISQLQEPFEQIRQTELNSRARKSRHAPFYLFTKSD